MSDPIVIKDQKFTKVKDVWVDQKKNPAPKELVPLLDKLAATYITPPLPTIQPTKTENTKIETVLAKLTSSIERLVRSVDKLNNTEAKKAQTSEQTSQALEQPALRVSAPPKIPSLMGAMGSNVKEFFTGKKDEYGRVTQPGLLRDLTKTVLPPTGLIFAAQDRKREAIAQQKIYNEQNSIQSSTTNNTNQSSTTTNNTNQSSTTNNNTNQSSTTNNNTNQSNTQAVPIVPLATGKDEKTSTMSNGQSKYAAKEFGQEKIQSVNIVDIDDSAIKKLADIFGKNKEESDKKKPDASSMDGGLLGGFFGSLLIGFKNLFGKIASFIMEPFKNIGNFIKNLFGGGAKAPGAIPGAGSNIETRVDKLGRKYNVDTNTGQRVSNAAVAETRTAENVTEQAIKKPGVFSKIFGGSAKAASVEGAEKLGGSLLSKGLRGIPVLGAIAGAGLSGYETYKESGSVGKALFSGGGSLLGGLGGEVVGSAAGPVGTVAGGIAGSIGGGKLGEVAYDKFFGKPKPVSLAPIGIAQQTQALNITSQRVMQEKEKKMMSSSSPVITNVSSPTTNVMNNNQTIAGMTMGARGSLDLETYRTRAV